MLCPPPSPEKRLMREELYAELWKAVSTLDDRDQMIIDLFTDGKTEREIASMVDLSQRGVNYRKEKIFPILKEILADFYFSDRL